MCRGLGVESEEQDEDDSSLNAGNTKRFKPIDLD